MPYDPDASLTQRYTDALTDERISKFRRLVAQWVPGDDRSIPQEELDEKLRDLAFAATLAFAGTGRRGLKPRLDFFLMHVLTSSMFIAPLLSALRTPRARARLLTSYLTVFLVLLVSRGAPKLDAGLLMSYTAMPVPPSGLGKRHAVPDALGDPFDATGVNPWVALLPHALPVRDAHTIKAFRALYVAAQSYGTLPAGSLRGVNALPDGDKLDGSAFVRAAGVLIDFMGWVGPGEGQKEGGWDRSALGWDAAWDEEKNALANGTK